MQGRTIIITNSSTPSFLLALVDAQYKLLWVDVGAMGSAGDANVFNHSELRACIDDETIGFPQPDPLPGDDADMPYFLVGDLCVCSQDLDDEALLQATPC